MGEDRAARVRRTAPRVRKLRDWRRNRWAGARHTGTGRDRDREHVGRPWEGRGRAEAERQAPAVAA